MKTSFDEVRKIAFRALDAAGAPPGIDDDGGWACAWLEAAGFAGLTMLADLLDDTEGRNLDSGISAIQSGQIDAAGRSAVTLAGLIVEYAAACPGGIKVQNLLHSPFLVAHAARLSDRGIDLRIDPVSMAECNVTIRHAGTDYADKQVQVRNAIHQGVEVDTDAFNRVYAYSRRVLVPQSETSLMSGAGAGLTDND